MKNKLISFLILSILLILVQKTALGFDVSGQFEIQQSLFCGDGIVSRPEQCDGSNLANQTCITRGYDSGTLSCTETCMFNESLCIIKPQDIPPSGNGGNGKAPPVLPSEPDTSPHAITQCMDQIDNDNDGFCDYIGCVINGTWYPPDSDCTSALDDSEYPAPDILPGQATTEEEIQKSRMRLLWLIVLLILIILITSYIIYKEKKKREQQNKYKFPSSLDKRLHLGKPIPTKSKN